jgi:hypothetical protein
MNRINISLNQSLFFVLPSSDFCLLTSDFRLLTSDFGLQTIPTIFNIITFNHDRKGKIN